MRLAPGALADPELAGATEARFHALLELLRDRASFAATSRALIADRFEADRGCGAASSPPR